jgi:hypothetical protein
VSSENIINDVLSKYQKQLIALTSNNETYKNIEENNISNIELLKGLFSENTL